MPVQAMNHFTVLSDDLARTTAFYERFLGLQVGWRPPFAFPGAWLYAGDQAVLHVVAGRSLPPERAGVLDHMAFTGTGLAATAAQLTAEGASWSDAQIEARLVGRACSWTACLCGRSSQAPAG